jgi:hypothetical protein
MTDPVNVNFQLKGIELMDVNLNHPQIQLNPERLYNFNIQVEQRINIAEKMVVVISSVDMIHEEDKVCHASIKVSCIYAVDNMMDFVSKKNQQVEFPEQFVTTLNSISLSTTRGVMFSQFRGTFMHNILLPIVNPTALNVKKAN